MNTAGENFWPPGGATAPEVDENRNLRNINGLHT